MHLTGLYGSNCFFFSRLTRSICVFSRVREREPVKIAYTWSESWWGGRKEMAGLKGKKWLGFSFSSLLPCGLLVYCYYHRRQSRVILSVWSLVKRTRMWRGNAPLSRPPREGRGGSLTCAAPRPRPRWHGYGDSGGVVVGPRDKAPRTEHRILAIRNDAKGTEQNRTETETDRRHPFAVLLTWTFFRGLTLD